MQLVRMAIECQQPHKCPGPSVAVAAAVAVGVGVDASCAAGEGRAIEQLKNLLCISCRYRLSWFGGD